MKYGVLDSLDKIQKFENTYSQICFANLSDITPYQCFSWVYNYAKYFIGQNVPHPFKRQMRALWYYVQCDHQKLRIEPKFIKKIKKYKDNPADCVNRVLKHRYSIAPGTTIIRHFRNIEHKVLVNYDNTFLYNGKQYRSLSAIASDICGAKTSGPHFFELDKSKCR